MESNDRSPEFKRTPFVASELAVISADLGKLHSEINQFRNQEFLVCTGAIALFGAAVPFLKGDPVIGLGLLFVLLGLFLWHYSLVDTRTRLVTYLKATRQSQWELVYREFSLETDAPSQRTAALVIFLLLGLLTPIAVFGHDFQCAYLAPAHYEVKTNWVLAYGLLGTFYAGLTTYFGRIQDYKAKLRRYEERWEELLRKNGIDISGPAHALNQVVQADVSRHGSRILQR